MPPIFALLRATATEKQLAREEAVFARRDHGDNAATHLKSRLSTAHMSVHKRRVFRLALWYAQRR